MRLTIDLDAPASPTRLRGRTTKRMRRFHITANDPKNGPIPQVRCRLPLILHDTQHPGWNQAQSKSAPSEIQEMPVITVFHGFPRPFLLGGRMRRPASQSGRTARWPMQSVYTTDAISGDYFDAEVQPPQVR